MKKNIINIILSVFVTILLFTTTALAGTSTVSVDNNGNIVHPGGKISGTFGGTASFNNLLPASVAARMITNGSSIALTLWTNSDGSTNYGIALVPAPYMAGDNATNTSQTVPPNTNSLVSAAQSYVIASQLLANTPASGISAAQPVLVLESQGGDVGQAMNAQFAAGMQRKGYIRIIGYENIEGPNAPYGTPALDSILNYMGISPEIGSSTNVSVTYAVSFTNYNQYISRYQNNASYPNMTLSMRKLLSQQQTNSVVLYIAGPSAALSDFLNSPADQYGGTGTQLISNYCSYAVIMAGGYPSNLFEFNLTTSPVTDNSYSAPLWPTNVPQFWIDYQAGTNIYLMTTNFSQYLEAQSPLVTYMTQSGNFVQTGRWSWDSMAFLATYPQFMTNFFGIQIGHLDTGLTNNIGANGTNWWLPSATCKFQNHISFTNFPALTSILNLMCLVSPDSASSDHVMFSSGITNQNEWPKIYTMYPEFNAASGTWMTNLIHEQFETGCTPWPNIYGIWTNDFGGYPLNFNSVSGEVDWHQTGTNAIVGNSSAEFFGTAGTVYAGFEFTTINVTNVYVHMNLVMSALPGATDSAFQLCAQPFILGNSGQAANVNITTGGNIQLFNGSTTSSSVGAMVPNVAYDIWMFYSTSATCWAAFSTNGTIPTSGNNYVSEAANHNLGISGVNLTAPFQANFFVDNLIVSTNPIPIQFPPNQYPYVKLINPLTVNVPWTNIYPFRLDVTATVQITNSASLINSDIYITNFSSGLYSLDNPNEAFAETNPVTLNTLTVFPGEVICVTNVANCSLIGSYVVQH